MAASVTSRALAVLGAFDPDHRSLSLSEIGRRAGLPLATAHRLVGELHAWGALARRPSGEYVIGRRMWDLGLLAPVQSGLREAASPFLYDLYGATLATVHLAVRDGCEALYVDRLSGHESVPVVSTIGSRLPLHATGVGKVLLAYAPDEVRQEAFGRLVRVTPYTVTQPARLAEQLRKVRIDGFATTAEEMSAGASSIAVPVRGKGDDVVAALGIVVADLRREQARLVAALRVASSGISRTLGLSSSGD
ncbi:IclR family transcriptional regulator [Actinoplanes bogorensis]|uniref:IclR family transcriptional regulator n=1 Tax=Paractinoplanes bogorensis TaxID=1610840 RepID=A0ABS5Z0H8_9ACTN|nr:IclR family transcriptional regulator [Actinoplanes bogorensis]MBU2669193.1 IclR family transcriptional regulator [Actinoplanes bogorensis]